MATEMATPDPESREPPTDPEDGSNRAAIAGPANSTAEPAMPAVTAATQCEKRIAPPTVIETSYSD
jgi:hypothetical protein